MNEVQAAIEAAGLPAPHSIAIQWEGDGGGFKVRDSFEGRWYVEQWMNVTNSWDPVPIRAEYVPTAAEACAKVKEWLNER